MEREENKGDSKKGDSSKKTSITLDCGVQGCCPTLHRLPAGGFELVGDDGQKVQLSDAQAKHMQSAIDELLGS